MQQHKLNLRQISVILLLLNKIKIPIIISLALLGILTAVYLKGRNDAVTRASEKNSIEVAQRLVGWEKQSEKIDRKITKIKQSRKSNDDGRDSCLLSNNPLEVECLKDF